MFTGNEAVIESIVGAIRRLNRAVYLDASRTSREFGLTRSQSGVLKILDTYGPLSSADLSRKLYMTPSNMTGIIDRLEKKGLVDRTRQPVDRRVVLITLTESGKDLSRQLPDSIERKLVSELIELSPEQIQMLSKAMNQIVHLMDAHGVEDTPLELNHMNTPGAADVVDETFR
ncbi:MAG: MarR family transcriptional regulator [Deltaproteobacteria bacterium]|nr:MarR family transcriptional regulator [Deltaproteobacteria bacterium]